MNLVNLPKIKSALIIVGVSSTVLFSCNNNLTRQDVKDEVEDAREATAEAQEETQEAIAAREQFYEDFKENKTDELEGRMKDIDKRIKELNKTSRRSENESATADMDAAIGELKNEKDGLQRRINEIQAMQAKDWSDSYEEINQAVTTMEGEIDKLSQSLEGSSN